MRLVAFENSTTLNSSVSPALAVVPSSLASCLAGAKPSTLSPSETTAPLSLSSVIVPVWIESTANCCSNAFQGFSSSCLWPRLRRRLSLSISRTTTSVSAPICVNSEGCFTFLVQLRSEMWIRPSIPSSISTNTPKLVKLRTLAVWREPTAYLVSISAQGSGVSCLRPSDILRSSRSRVSTTASTSSPTFMNSCAERRCWLQDISDTWIRPSTPGAISTNAP